LLDGVEVRDLELESKIDSIFMFFLFNWIKNRSISNNNSNPENLTPTSFVVDRTVVLRSRTAVETLLPTCMPPSSLVWVRRRGSHCSWLSVDKHRSASVGGCQCNDDGRRKEVNDSVNGDLLNVDGVLTVLALL
jgi:hypothetical protein